jgi:spore coat polysaccharide biosynthesis protein SpsF
VRTVAVVQARLGSTRLPGKVLMDVAGEPAVTRLVRNMLTVPELDEVVLAVPVGDVDKADWPDLCDIYPGDEHDVLQRYARCAKWYEADVIVRLTADCPMIDPALVSRAIKAYKGEGYYWEQGYPRGLGDIELFSRRSLDEAQRREPDIADGNGHVREHVFRGVIAAAAVVGEKVRWPWCPDELRRPTYRLCLDEQADLDAIRAVLDTLGNPPVVSVGEVVALLDHRPDLREINAHVQQVS